MNNEQRWKEKYRNDLRNGPYWETPSDNTFRSLVDNLVHQVYEGLCDLDEIEGAAYLVSEIVKEQMLRHPDWKPKTAEERKAELAQEILMSMITPKTFIIPRVDPESSLGQQLSALQGDEE